MAALDLRVLVLERLSRKWIINDSGGGSGSGGEPGPGAGQVGAVAFWTSGTGLTYDAPFHYDAAMHRLGIGTQAPTAPLTFASTVEQKLHLYTSGAGGVSRYGLGIASSVLQIFAPTFAHIDLGIMSDTDGVSFATSMSVLGTGTTFPLWVGIGYPPLVGTWLKSGGAIIDSLRLGGDTTVARWQLDCPGLGYVQQLGVYYGPDTAVTAGVDFRTRLAQIDNLGVGYAPVTGYSIRAASAWCDGVYVAGGYDARWSFVNWGASYFSGSAQFAVGVGMGYAPGAYALRCGAAHFDHIGVSEAPVGGWFVTTYNLLVRANTQTDSLHVLGASTFTGVCGFGVAANPSVNIRANSIYPDYLCVQGALDTRFVARFYNLIYCDGVPYSAYPGPWQAYSDVRLKRIHGPIPHPLETMTALRGVLFAYTENDMGRPAGVRMGCIAQEVEEVLPAWVGELDGYKTTQLSAFEALCIEAVKELTQRVAALEARLCP